MTTPYFSKPSDLAPVTKARSVDINNLSTLIAAAFAKVPDELALKSGAANYAVDSGAGNAYVATLDAKVAAYADGLEVKLRVTRANTGAATLAVNGMGAIAIKRIDGSAAQAGDIPAGSTLALVYSAAMNAFCLPAVVASTLNQAVAAAAQSVLDAAAQAQAAATSAGQSQGYATNSSNSAQASATSASAAEASRIAADKRFLGNKAAPPAVDNQGAALQAGAAYYDTTLGKIQVWNGAAWTAGIATIAGVSSLNGNTGDLTLKTIGGASLLGTGDISANAIQRFSRVANTQLVAADKSKWIFLSGTFTQTFDTVASLGQGWFVYISNNGTGNITIPLSDGVANWIMYPGETRLFVCDGTSLTSVVMSSYKFVSQVSGTWIKPPGYKYHHQRLTGSGAGGGGGGGGGSGGTSNPGYGGAGGGGGSGGAAGLTLDIVIPDYVLPGSVPFTIGIVGTGGVGSAGGSAATANGSSGYAGTTGNSGLPGNASTFGTSGQSYYLSAPGGQVAGTGGPGASANGTSPSSGTTTTASTSLLSTANGALILATAAPGPSNGGSAARLISGNSSQGGDGGSGGLGGAPASTAPIPTAAPSVVGGAIVGSFASNGSNGVVATAPGAGGQGGGGGAGSAGCGGTAAAVGQGGNGGNGANGTPGSFEISGVV